MIEKAKKFKCGACGNDKFNIYQQEDNDQELFVECLALHCNTVTVVGFTQPKINLGWHEDSDGIMAIF